MAGVVGVTLGVDCHIAESCSPYAFRLTKQLHQALLETRKDLVVNSLTSHILEVK